MEQVRPNADEHAAMAWRHAEDEASGAPVS
jgi:hypothetical protein